MKKPILLASRAALAAFALGLSACGGAGDPLSEAEAAMERNAFREARVQVAKLLKENPQDQAALLIQARASLELGDGVGAAAALDRLEEAGVPAGMDAGELAGLRAHALMIQDKDDEARPLAVSAAETDAKAAWVEVQLSARQDELGMATTLSDAAIARFKDNPALLTQRATIELVQRRIDLARRYSERALAADEDFLPAMMLEGQLALMRDDFPRARDIYAAALEKHPDSLATLFALAAVEADLGNLEEARRQIDRLRAGMPDHPMALFLDAKLAFHEGDLDKAQQLLQQRENDMRQLPAAQLLMGEVSYLRGNEEQALDSLRRFLETSPGHIHASTVYAYSLIATGDEDAAWEVVAPLARRADAAPQMIALAARLASGRGDRSAFEQRLAQSDDPRLSSGLGKADKAIAQGDWQKAADEYRKLREAGFTSNPVALNNGALAALELGNETEALQLAREAVSLAPDDPRVADTLGWVLLKTGTDKARALTLLEKASREMPSNLQVRWHYANALAANGRTEQAKREMRAVRKFAGPAQQERIDALIARL